MGGEVAATPRAVTATAVSDPGVELPPVWESGTRFSRYQIEARLAAGGMAEIWRARIKGIEGFEKRIVIKTMQAHLGHRPELVQMFVSEASLAAQLDHPNIVQVFDFGKLEGRFFIAMEHVPGVTLRYLHKRLRARGERLAVPTGLQVMLDVCAGLEAVHQLADDDGPMGLIHRDVSPDNVILSTTGAAKLIDFGAARATLRTPPTPIFVGKVRYAAPERVQQAGEDRRSDVYSAGVMLYECLVGARPFDGSEGEVINAVTTSGACDPRAKDRTIPDRVAAVVMKATARDPADRYPTARALGDALADLLASRGTGSRLRGVTASLATLLEASAETTARAETDAATTAVGAGGSETARAEA